MTDITISLYFNMHDPAFPDAPELGNSPHAQVAMRHLGISYKWASCHPIADCWRFYDCENIPDDLPSWIRVSDPATRTMQPPYGGVSHK